MYRFKLVATFYAHLQNEHVKSTHCVKFTVQEQLLKESRHNQFLGDG